MHYSSIAALNSNDLPTFARQAIISLKTASNPEIAFNELESTVNALSKGNIPQSSPIEDLMRDLLLQLQNIQKEICEVKSITGKESLQKAAIEAVIPQIQTLAALQIDSSPELKLELSHTPLSKVIDEFFQTKIAEGAWTEKSKLENKAGYNLFLEIVGDKPIGEIKHAEVNEYVRILRQLPANIKKVNRVRTLSPREIIELPKITPRSPQTVKKEVIRVGALFEFAVTYGYTDRNYASRKATIKTTRPQDQRDRFTIDELKALLFSKENLMQINKKRKHEYAFWLPLLAMFTGGRLNEICQLQLSDIKQVEGIWCIHFQSGDGKRIKTKSGERLIPIHSKLIKLGLLKRIERLKKQKQKQLFPELTRSRDGHGALASKWFGRYRKRCGVTGKKKVFHSFRHTVADTLKQNNVPLHDATAILGHADKSQTYGRYGKIFKPKALVEAIERLDYKIDFSPLMSGSVNPEFEKVTKKRRRSSSKTSKN